MKTKSLYKRPLIISVLLHIVIFSLLFIHFNSSRPSISDNVKIVQAVAIDESQLRPDVKQPQELPEKQIKPVTNNVIRHIEQVELKQTPSEKSSIPKQVAIKKEPEISHDSLPEPVAKELIEKIALEKKRQEQQLRKQELKRKQQELAKKRLEDERKQLQNELAKEAHQQKVKADTSEQAEPTDDNEDENKEDTALQEKVTQEQQQLSAQKVTAQAGELDQYKQKIIIAISRKWIIPDVDNNDLSCQLLVHLAPGGMVLSVDVLEESGNVNLDRSARDAIIKASPLPTPEDSELFDKFRTLRLTFRPQGIVSE